MSANVGSIDDGFMCTEFRSITRFLQRFPREKLLHLLKDLKYISETEFQSLQAKRARTHFISNLIRQHFENGIKYKQIADLDLQLCYFKSTTHQWKVYKMEALDKFPTQTTKKLETNLRIELGAYFKHHTIAHSFEDSIWIRICIIEGKLTHESSIPRNNTIFYAVYYPTSEYLMFTSLKQEFKSYILQAFCNCFEAKDIEELDLTGKHIPSLIELLINRNAQGSIKSIAKQNEDQNPLDRKKKRKRKDEEDEILLDQDSRVKIDKEIEKVFGVHEQPIMDKFLFKVQGNFKGKEESNFAFNSQILLEGTNVLEGMKNMVKAGIIKTPLPDWMSEISAMSANVVTLSTTLENQTE